MKRKNIAGILALTICLVSACSKGADSPVEKYLENKADNAIESAEQNNSADDSLNSDVLSGVYKDGDQEIIISMGTMVDDASTIICEVKLPANYNVYASYVTDEGYYMDFDNAYNVRVSDAYEHGAWNEDKVMARCLVVSTDGDPVTQLQIDVTNENYGSITLDGDCQEVKNSTYRTFFCSPTSEYVENDETVYVILSDDILVTVKYTGPLDDKYGMEKLAENIQGLFSLND